MEGIVSGTSIGSIVIRGGTDVGNAVGDIVEMAPTAAWGSDLYSGLTVEHNRNGTHGAVTATSLAATGAVTAASFNTTAANGINQAALPLGVVVQVVATNFSALATGTTIIPRDDTIPQITEGDQYMTQAITPKSTTNILVIEALVYLSALAATRRLIAALFQDSTANALAVGEGITETATASETVAVRHTMTAGTTSSTTFRIRAGADSATTVSFNGVNGVRTYGGITLSSIKITEYKA